MNSFNSTNYVTSIPEPRPMHAGKKETTTEPDDCTQCLSICKTNYYNNNKGAYSSCKINCNVYYGCKYY